MNYYQKEDRIKKINENWLKTKSKKFTEPRRKRIYNYYGIPKASLEELESILGTNT